MKLNRDERKALSALGRFLLMHQRDDDAAALFGALARAAADDPYGWYGLGVVAERRGEVESALGYFQRASELSPRGEYALSLGECLVRDGQPDAAVGPLKRAAAADDEAVSQRANAILRRLTPAPAGT